MNTRINIIILTILGFVVSSCQPQAKPDYTSLLFAPDSLMGDWQGTMAMSDDEKKSLVAQVIAYKDNNYQINFLNQFDTRDSVVAKINGSKKNGEIEFSGRDKTGNNWSGYIKGKEMSGSFSGEMSGKFELKKITRLSPTLGLEAPDNAHVLFDGRNLEKWVHVPSRQGYVNLADLIGGNNSVAYMHSEIWSEDKMNAVLLVGSDDGNKIWHNGQLVHEINISREAAPAQDTIKISLVKGWNIFLFKIINGDGGWGAGAQLTDNQGKQLKNIREKNFLDNNQATDEFLKGNNSFLTVWRISGPFTFEGAKIEELYSFVFPPENDLKSASWQSIKLDQLKERDASWTIIDNAFQVKPGSGSIMTRRKFNDFNLHIEFRSPFMPDVKGQSRGNSGVYLQGRYEIQVLDSYGLVGKDNECGGFYKVAAPRVNMCAPPVQWQTYDIDFETARYDADGKKLKNAVVTVKHNGVIIHENLEIPMPTAGGLDKNPSLPGPILLQDHSDRVQYRNIWIVEK